MYYSQNAGCKVIQFEVVWYCYVLLLLCSTNRKKRPPLQKSAIIRANNCHSHCVSENLFSEVQSHDLSEMVTQPL